MGTAAVRGRGSAIGLPASAECPGEQAGQKAQGSLWFLWPVC